MNQKFCEHCGAPLNDGDEFCRQCGARVNQNVTPNNSQEMKNETVTPSSNSINTRTSFILSIIGVSTGGIGAILDFICLFMPINTNALAKVFLKFLSTSLEVSVLGLIFSIVGLILNKPNSYKNKLSKNLSIIGIVVSALALIGYLVIYLLAIINSSLI
jgi:hypothetical protein